jgi:hypothetical protein
MISVIGGEMRENSNFSRQYMDRFFWWIFYDFTLKMCQKYVEIFGVLKWGKKTL